MAGKGVEMRVRTAKNKTPLMYAASLGDAQLIRVLCKVPKHLVEGVDARDGNFHTALHSACCWGWVECAQVLIENGADIHATGKNINSYSPYLLFLISIFLIFQITMEILLFIELQCGIVLM